MHRIDSTSSTKSGPGHPDAQGQGLCPGLAPGLGQGLGPWSAPGSAPGSAPHGHRYNRQSGSGSDSLDLDLHIDLPRARGSSEMTSLTPSLQHPYSITSTNGHHNGTSSYDDESQTSSQRHLTTTALSPFSNVNKRATTFLLRLERDCSGTQEVSEATKKSFLLMPPIKVGNHLPPFMLYQYIHRIHILSMHPINPPSSHSGNPLSQFTLPMHPLPPPSHYTHSQYTLSTPPPYPPPLYHHPINPPSDTPYQPTL